MQVYVKILIVLASVYFVFVEGAIRCEFRKYLVPGNLYYIYSPGFPRDFSTGVNCRWIVTTAPGFVCRLECPQFVLDESILCSTDRLLVSNNGDPLLLNPNTYCGKRTITEVSVGQRISMSLQAARNTTGGRFLCQVSTEKETIIETSSPAAFSGPSPKLQQPWFKAWVDSVKEITSQLNFNGYERK